MFAGNSPYGTGTPNSASSFSALAASNSHHHMNMTPGGNTQTVSLDNESHSHSRAPGTAFSAPPPPNTAAFLQVGPPPQAMQYQSHYAPPPPMYSQYAPPQSINASPTSMMSPYAPLNHNGFPSPYASMGGPAMNQQRMTMGMQATMTGAPNMYIKDEAADAAMIAAMSGGDPTGGAASGRKRKKPTTAAVAAVAAGIGPAGAVLNSNGMYVPLRSQLDAEARATRIRKHNEAEVRRRQRLKNLLTELGQAIECKKEHKSAILRAAIERVKILSDKLSQCGVNVKELLQSAEKAQQLSGDGDDDDDEDVEEKEIPAARQAKAPCAETTQSAPAVVTNDSKRAKTDSSVATTTSSAAVKVEPEAIPTASVTSNSPVVKKTSGALLTVEKETKTQASTPISSPVFAPAVDTIAPPILGVDHHAIFHSSSVAMDIVDPQGNILDCNQAFANFCGYPREVLIQSGTTFLGLTHPDSLQESFKIMSALISGQKRVIRGNKKYVNSKGVVKNTIITCWLIPRDLHKRREANSQGNMSSSSSESNGSHTSNTSNPTATPVTGSTLIQAMIEEIPMEWTWQDYLNSLAQALQPVGRSMGPMGPPAPNSTEKSASLASNAAASSSASPSHACPEPEPMAVPPTVAVVENSS